MIGKIILAGANSQVGHRLTELLGEWEIITLGRGAGCTRRFEARDRGMTEDLADLRADVLVNCVAAFGGVSGEAWEDTAAVNTLGALRLCLLAEQWGVRHFVQISTVSADYQEGQPYYGIYALSKRQANELLLLRSRESGMKLTVLKPSQIYSFDRAAQKHQSFLYAVAAQVAAGKDVSISGSHDAWRNYIHVDDVCTAVRLTVEKGIGGEYAVAALHSLRISEMFELLREAVGSKSQLSFNRTGPDLGSLPEMFEHTLYDKLGWQPQLPLEQCAGRFMRGLGYGG